MEPKTPKKTPFPTSEKTMDKEVSEAAVLKTLLANHLLSG